MKLSRSKPLKQNARNSAGDVSVLQRQCSCGRHSGAGGECDACRRKTAAALGESAASSSIPATVHQVLQSPGQPLDPAARSVMEPRFGRDFSGVRVHADAAASHSSRELGAAAYTVGNHIAFQVDRYNPSSAEGRHLLAHELAHVAQHQRTGIASGAAKAVSDPSDGAEREASAAARLVSGGQNAQVSQPAGALIHRDSGDTARALGIVGGVVGAVGLGFGIAALAGAFSSRGSAVPDLPSSLAERLQPACTSTATAATRQSALDALVQWARTQSSLGINWSRIDWVRYDTASDARGSSTNADDAQHIRLSFGPEAFSSVANLYSTFRHELVHVQEHETRPRAEILTRGQGVQEIYAYLWELEHQNQTGLSRRENWGLGPDGTADHSVGLSRVVDGVVRAMFRMGNDLQQNHNAVPMPEQQAIERRIACGMIATPREVVLAVFPQAPLQQWQRECAQGVAAP